MDSRQVIKALKDDGWVELKSKATDHRQFRHPTKPGKVTVAHPLKDIPRGTLGSIEKQSGLKLR